MKNVLIVMLALLSTVSFAKHYHCEGNSEEIAPAAGFNTSGEEIVLIPGKSITFDHQHSFTTNLVSTSTKNVYTYDYTVEFDNINLTGEVSLQKYGENMATLTRTSNVQYEGSNTKTTILGIYSCLSGEEYDDSMDFACEVETK